MDESPVTVRTFLNVAEADACRALLESEGIPTFVADEATVGMDWFLGNAVGYVKLQVRPTDVERATELLKEIPEPAVRREMRTAEGDDVCLACGGAMGQETVCPQCGWTFSISLSRIADEAESDD